MALPGILIGWLEQFPDEVQGEPERQVIGCTGQCGDNQFELTRDTYTDALCDGQCFQGHHSLCCDSTELLSQCFWSGCQGPLNPAGPIGELDSEGCPDGYESVASRFDTDGGSWCSWEMGSNLHGRFKRGLCCPTSKGFNNCQWTTQSDGDLGLYEPERACRPRQCSKIQTKLAEAYEPAPINAYLGGRAMCEGDCIVGDQCSAYRIEE